MIFFFLAIRLNRMEELFGDLQHYVDSSGRILLAGETCDKHPATDGEHFHIAVDMTENQYLAFYKTIIKGKYKLNGRATKSGGGRQYGRVKDDKIRDETKFLTYTVKTKNIMSQNFDIEQLQKYIDNSFIKEEKMTKVDALMKYLAEREHDIYKQANTFNNHNDEPEINIERLEFIIFQWHKDIWSSTKVEVPSPSQIKNLALRFLMYNSQANYLERDYQIFTYLKYNK